MGGSLRDGQGARENFVSRQDAGFFAGLYREKGLTGGHVILLNSKDSPLYEATRQQAIKALATYPGGLQVGGGVNEENAGAWLEAGASHVICTSYVFSGGKISWERLQSLCNKIGRERLVLDLSCAKREGDYYIVTDRWQRFTEEPLTADLLGRLGAFCDEFLVHAVDKEGKRQGADLELAALLASCTERPVTYAGGIGSLEDIERLKEACQGRLDVTVGSALDLFGGNIPFETLLSL